MFLTAFKNTIYVRVYKNKFHIRHIENLHEIIVLPENSFTTERLIIGQFTNAEKTLNKGIKDLYGRKLFSPSPNILIQQMEMNEEGLSEVEERVLTEVAMQTGARKVLVWTGKKQLMDSEVLKKFKNV